MDTTAKIRELNDRWTKAEEQGDGATLAALSADGFTLVGPLGYVLDRDQWIGRYSTGDLVTQKLEWHDAEVHEHGDCVVEVGVHTQQAAYRGQPNDGSFRSTHVWVRDGDDWKLASIHLGQMPPATPPAAPPGGARG